MCKSFNMNKVHIKQKKIHKFLQKKLVQTIGLYVYLRHNGNWLFWGF